MMKCVVQQTWRTSSFHLSKYLESLDGNALDARKTAAEMAIMEMGITFTVYSDEGNIDRAWPFDIIPRIIEYREWKRVEKDLKQRLKALNCFIYDIIVYQGWFNPRGNY